MTTVQSTTAQGTAQASSAPAAAKPATLTADFNMFVKLMIAQVQNQDPLSPMDTAQYTQQLATYSQVEQAMAANQKLGNMLDALAGSTLTDSARLIGTQVATKGPETTVANGIATWTLASAPPAGSRWEVLDAAGHTAASGDLPQGATSFAWQAPAAMEGRAVNLRLLDQNGNALATGIASSGVVTAVTRSGNDVMLDVGGRSVALSDVSRVG